MILVLGITLPLAMGLGIFVGMHLLETKTPSVVAAAPKVAKEEPKEKEKPPETLVERAAGGDFKAIDEIKKRGPNERTAEETLALARGRSVNKRLALEGFAAELKKNPDLLKDPQKIARLKDFLLDRETTNQAAGVLVSLPGSLGPDLLYEAFVATKNRSETTTLTEELLQAKEVREKASPALTVALDLRNAEECEQFKEILPRAADKGDRRSLTLLGKLISKRGCGAAKRDDCYACLRPLDDDKQAVNLAAAIKTVRGRAAPKY